MKLTKEEYDNFVLQKVRLKNIFDVLVLLYSYIDGRNKKKYRSEYFKFLQMHSKYWKKLELLNNEFLGEMISFTTFLDRIWELFTQDNVRYYAFKMLFSYEHYISEGYKVLKPEICRSLHQKMSLLGPVNTFQEKYSFYLMPCQHFFRDYNSSRPKDSQIRFLDQSEFFRIDERIKSYKIIDTNRLGDKVEVIGYNQSKFALPQKLEIAIVPMSPCKWFEEIYLPKKEEAHGIDSKIEKNSDVIDIVITDNEKNLDIINNAYTRILERCIKENVQIVVFPEFARNRNTLSVVKEFLSQSMGTSENSLELVFLGSYSNNARNEAILLNGSGTELLKVSKKFAYKKRKDGILYREQLIDFNEKITLIDIPKMGRIQYSICKDGLNAAAQNTLWSAFEISFSVISAFSESLSHFKELGSSFSTQYGGIQIVANSCASRMSKVKAGDEQKLELGNVIIPCSQGIDMSVSKKIINYETNKYCWNECSKQAGVGSCIRIMNIFPNEESENEELCISQKNIIL